GASRGACRHGRRTLASMQFKLYITVLRLLRPEGSAADSRTVVAACRIVLAEATAGRHERLRHSGPGNQRPIPTWPRQRTFAIAARGVRQEFYPRARGPFVNSLFCDRLARRRRGACAPRGPWPTSGSQRANLSLRDELQGEAILGKLA